MSSEIWVKFTCTRTVVQFEIESQKQFIMLGTTDR